MNKLAFLIADIPEDVRNLITTGDFEKVRNLIDLYLKRNISILLKERLNFEKYRMEILKKEYIYDHETALKLAQKEIKDFTKEELETLKNEKYADWIYINKKIMFHKRFLENIIKVHPNIGKRLITQSQEDNKVDDLLNKTIDEIIEKGEKQYFFHLKTGLSLKKDKLYENQIVRVHLPIPQNALQIQNIKILETSSQPKFVAPESYPQRTIFFEENTKELSTYTVEYSYENHIKYTNINYDNVSSQQPKFHTEEWPPQILFTPFLVDLAKEIIQNEKNPIKKARKIYDYITTNVQYSYVRPYISILNIPEYAAYNLKGDCGVQAILFITLCRIVGIPSRWQSGLFVTPFSISPHDWAQFYIEPYGWLFADLSFGGSAYRKNNIKKWNFYFGNLDPFRMVANSEFHYPLLPEKKFLRSDPYDNQIGEAEYLDRAIYQDEFEPIMQIIEAHEL
ncbi:hypothetical protein PW5551_08295 [Petrotoga sp. 9PW.55.5.1]|uniref:transglutaminase-like domain-containing protein n=1 Tax=Petrotoga sp. 9PW.55.5.1 TaxID=1308979 RepID=UPI000DC53F50|nr:transglutaminase-like domain-containing protein [Petrotoga sp. 9PW.55.5.1]RAO98700.1 hypothetical protein PW5551_08295 [Petrotoga sp. 9PW.55.5.1]